MLGISFSISVSAHAKAEDTAYKESNQIESKPKKIFKKKTNC